MRWYALGVDYEMSGKDLIDSVKLGSQICRVLGARPPEGFNYELFLDEQAKKISKSRSEEHTSELQSLMRSSYAVFCLKKKKKKTLHTQITSSTTNKENKTP